MSSSVLATIIIFGAFTVLMLTGLPVAFCLFTIGVIGVMFVEKEGRAAQWLFYNTINTDELWLLNAVPLFVFMAYILQKSGVAEDMYRCLHLWFGGVPGGLAMATMLMGVILGAMIGESSSGVATAGIIALPSMLERGYDKKLALGTVLAAGGLSSIIPPSVLMLVYLEEAEASFRRMFLGAIVPGLLLALLCIVYIGIRCLLKPSQGPPLAEEHRAHLKEKLLSLRLIVPPVLIAVIVFAMFFARQFMLSEAAAAGAAVALIIALVRRKLTWKDFSESSLRALEITCMIIWIVVGARVFRALYFVSGAARFLPSVVQGLPLGPLGIVLVINLLLLVLGMFLDPYLVLMITMMALAPLLKLLNLDMVWFGVLFLINMMIASMSPPVGYNVFCLKAIVPEDISMADVYRSTVPFILLHAFVMLLIAFFPAIALWLPDHLIDIILW